MRKLLSAVLLLSATVASADSAVRPREELRTLAAREPYFRNDDSFFRECESREYPIHVALKEIEKKLGLPVGDLRVKAVVEEYSEFRGNPELGGYFERGLECYVNYYSFSQDFGFEEAFSPRRRGAEREQVCAQDQEQMKSEKTVAYSEIVSGRPMIGKRYCYTYGVTVVPFAK